jgi:hypothetical protein
MSSKKKNINNSFPITKNKEVICFMEDNLSSHKDRNNNTTLLNGQTNEVTKQKNFMICELCLWCASSYIHSYGTNVAVKCPNCKDGTIELLPINDN